MAEPNKENIITGYYYVQGINLLLDINESNYNLYKNTNPDKYYVYALYDPQNHSIFYIGKGIKKRAWNHLSLTGINPIKENYISKLYSVGVQPQILILQDGLCENDSLKLESELIAKYYDYITNVAKSNKKYLSTYEYLCAKYGKENVKTGKPCNIKYPKVNLPKMNLEQFKCYMKNIVDNGRQIIPGIFVHDGKSYCFNKVLHLLK